MSELLTPAEMAEADRLTMASGTPGHVLMRRAGMAVADTVARMVPLGSAVSVLCGAGNNGGDGYVAARVLAERGYPVSVFAEGPPDSRAADAAAAAAAWTGKVLPLGAWPPARETIIVDALLGAGLARDIDGALAELIVRVNGSSSRIVAVDVPSGIDGASGQVRGVAIRAEETVTFFRRKPGHLLLPGRLHCGTVRLADIGIPAAVLGEIAPSCSTNAPSLWGDRYPWPRVEDHKYGRGHAVVVSGDLTHTGAARLAARGALRAGAGLVSVASPPEALAVNAAHLTAIMLLRLDGAPGLGQILHDRRRNVVCLGPALGIGEATRALVAEALASGAAVVLDADALTSFADCPEQLFTGIRLWPERPVVMTPHSGEFARLFGARGGESKLDAARFAADRSGAVVVHKGPDTVVASPDGRTSIAENGPPWLATAGSGDVLAGFVSGLMAQGMPAFEAASAAVWLHGEAGMEAGVGLIAEDLPEALPAVLGRLIAAG
jgi:hydroxyethylthiazole kinase-like uncharacterized protein yjeF